MTDKKFTDEEIIKRLERCVKRGNRNYDTDIVLDLINRQRTEISEWKEKYVKNFEKWELLDRRTRKFYAELYEEAKEVVKSEAIKEFAERLKEKIGDCHIVSDGEYCGFDCGDIHECIDNFVKEMVGEEE